MGENGENSEFATYKRGWLILSWTGLHLRANAETGYKEARWFVCTVAHACNSAL